MDKISQPTVNVVNWSNFKEALVINDRSYRIWTADTIELEAMLLQQAIDEALNKSTHKQKITAKQAHWWNADLFCLRRKVVELNFKMRSNPSDSAAKDDFVTAKNNFRKKCKKTRRQKWRLFCKDVTTPQKLSKFTKILNRNNLEHVGLFRKPDGSFTANSQESIDLLLRTHHPGCVPFTGDKHNTPSVTKNAKMHDQTRGPSLGSPVNQQRVVRQEGLRHNANGATSHERGRLYENRKFCTPAELNNSFITERAVYLSIHSFGPDKTGGPDGLKPKVVQYFVENKTALKRLTKLFQCMLEIGYTPKK